jgi:hypothetical protein
MHLGKRLAYALTLAAALGAAAPAWACPLCKEAAADALEDSEDPLAEARAYNQSIYFMLAVPYTIVGVAGFYCYRHFRGRGPDGTAEQG